MRTRRDMKKLGRALIAVSLFATALSVVMTWNEPTFIRIGWPIICLLPVWVHFRSNHFEAKLDYLDAQRRKEEADQSKSLSEDQQD